MNKLLHQLVTATRPIIHKLELLQPVAQLLARLFVAQAFFLAGLTKLRDWDTTLALFADEYHVPLLSPTVRPGPARWVKWPCRCCWQWAWAGVLRRPVCRWST
jgi:hypothetical protein